MSDPGPGPIARFFSLLLMSAGVLMSVLSGCCSLYFLFGLNPYMNGAGIWIWILLIGGVPFGLGIVLFYIGRGLGK